MKNNNIKKKIIAGSLAVLAATGVGVDEKVVEDKRVHFKEALVNYEMSDATADKISHQLKGGLLSKLRTEEKMNYNEYQEYIKTANRALKNLPRTEKGYVVPMKGGKVKVKNIILTAYGLHK